MAGQGRIEGRRSEDGTTYDLYQHGNLCQSIPIDLARADKRLRKAIKNNRWGEI